MKRYDRTMRRAASVRVLTGVGWAGRYDGAPQSSTVEVMWDPPLTGASRVFAVIAP